MLCRRSAVFAACLASLPASALAQFKAGAPFRVNTYTTADQFSPHVQAAPGGDFVVAWLSREQDGDLTGIFAQRFDGDAVPLGAEFRVNSYTTGYQGFNTKPAVGVDGRGSFVVAWSSVVPGGRTRGFGQRFNRRGQRLGAEFQVNTYTTTDGNGLSLGMNADGTFVVAWNAFTGQFDLTHVYSRRFTPDAVGLGTEFQVSNHTTGYIFAPEPAIASDGRFLIAWETPPPPPLSTRNLAARAFAADGTPLTPPFAVNAYTTSGAAWPSVKAAPDGTFVVAWARINPRRILARRYDASGNALGDEFRVDEVGTSPSQPTVAFDAAGRFVVAWADTLGGPFTTIQARRFNAGGSPFGSQFEVHSSPVESAFAASVASDPIGNFVVVWRTFVSGGNADVKAQRFGGMRPAGMVIDDGDNGVIELPEAFTVRPSWRNVTGQPQTIQTTSSQIVQPGVSFTISPDAIYGTIPADATGACTAKCYDASVGGPARPPGHVDVGFTETVSPQVQGQMQPWRLHVGGSFADVPRASPYYRFVETLLHRGVTSGCGGEDYCPAAATTREQMAVFLLVAKDGEGYVPPACSTPVFNDVPANGPFCRWIEELARRGVTGGCGGGNYCPTAPVSREQMAVFVLRTLDPNLNPPACTTPVFADVPASSPFCRWIEELARRGVVGGCAPNLYCPTAPVTREQMAVFLTGTFGLTLYGP